MLRSPGGEAIRGQQNVIQQGLCRPHALWSREKTLRTGEHSLFAPLFLGMRHRFGDAFRKRLQHVAEMGPANDWPTPFARHLLEVLQSGRSEADVEKHPADTDKRPAGTLSEAPEGSAKAPASP